MLVDSHCHLDVAAFDADRAAVLARAAAAGVEAQVIPAIAQAFGGEPPDIIAIDPIRNLFDGGPEGGGENDNTAMMFFLQDRVELLAADLFPPGRAALVVCNPPWLPARPT